MGTLISFISTSGIPAKLFNLEFEFNKDEYQFPHIPRELKPPQSIQSNESTSAASLTHTPQVILDLVNVDRHLRNVKFSDALWINLMHYADPSRYPPHANFNRNTLGITDDGETEASPRDVAVGVLAMHDSKLGMKWEAAEAIANSQQSSRDIAYEFVCRSTRLAILQRYFNEIEPVDDQDVQLAHQACWRANVVSQDRRYAAAGQAGRADGILQCRKERGTSRCNAILTTKPHWSYTSEVIAEIYDEDPVVDRASGDMNWHCENTGGLLLRQFWGSMVAMQCNFGIWTNGQTVFLAVKTGQNTLLMTQRHPWSHHETTKAIIGLTYAAIDDEGGKWADKGVDIIAELIGPNVPV